MPAGNRRKRQLIAKIRRLPEDKLADVEDFVECVHQGQEDRRLAGG